MTCYKKLSLRCRLASGFKSAGGGTAAAIALCVAAAAQVGPLPGMAVLPLGGLGPAAIVASGSGNVIATSTTQTVAAVGFGTAASNRSVSCGISGLGSGAFTVSSVTIGGVAATAGVSVNNAAAGFTNAIYTARVPTGTSGSIVATFSASVTAMAVSCYAISNLASLTPTASGTSIANTGSVALAINTNGVGFSFATAATSPVTFPDAAWVNMAEDVDTGNASSIRNYSSASHGGAQSNTVTVTWTSNIVSGDSAMVAAAFR